ncbi:MAG: hypothetical protein KAR06_00840, partial [Deltaproteobacteria bacterium]|nr:hypothetical protein [Deltaproteobacteria bacterium]
DAAALYCQTSDWERLSALVMTHAQALLMQGRAMALEGWIKCFPEEVLEDSPWLIFWLGTSKTPFNPPEASIHLERAFNLFDAQKNPAGVFLSWSGVVESIILYYHDLSLVDTWIERLDKLLKKYPAYPSPEIEARVTCWMFNALYHRQPHHRDTRLWLDRAMSLTDKSTNTDFIISSLGYISIYFAFVGDFKMMSLLTERVKELALSGSASDMWRITAIFAESLNSTWRTPENSLAAVNKGLALSRSSGVNIWTTHLLINGASASFIKGDLSAGGKFLKETASVMERARRADTSQYQLLIAWYGLLRGRIPEAMAHVQKALDLAVAMGAPFAEAHGHYGLAQALHERGEHRKAAHHLKMFRGVGGKGKEYEYLLAAAQFGLDRGRETEGLKLLRGAMAIGSENDYGAFWFWQPDVMARLCTKALAEGIEVEYVKGLIRRFN